MTEPVVTTPSGRPNRTPPPAAIAIPLAVGAGASRLIDGPLGFLALIGGVVVAAALGLVFARDEAFRTFAPIIRLIFLLWICLTVVVTVLIPLDSFSDENVTILGVAWLGVVALWCLDGLAAARAARSNGDSGSLTTRPGHEA